MNHSTSQAHAGIPLPIVTLNRATIVLTIVLAGLVRAWLPIAFLFIVIAPAALIGKRASLVYWLGRSLFARWNEFAEREDERLMRFNNCIAAVLLGLSTLAFVFGAPSLGWVFAGMVALAAFVALCGYCLGCTLYLWLKLARRRLANF